jgi:hypothetical protein
MGDVIEHATGRFWIDDDGVVRCVATPMAQSADDAREAMRIFAELGGGTKRPVVTDISAVRSLGRDARGVYTGDGAAAIWTACALVVSTSAVARTIGNFVLTVSPPALPTRLFSRVDEALAWARGYLGRA